MKNFYVRGVSPNMEEGLKCTLIVLLRTPSTVELVICVAHGLGMAPWQIPPLPPLFPYWVEALAFLATANSQFRLDCRYILLSKLNRIWCLESDVCVNHRCFGMATMGGAHDVTSVLLILTVVDLAPACFLFFPSNVCLCVACLCSSFCRKLYA